MIAGRRRPASNDDAEKQEAAPARSRRRPARQQQEEEPAAAPARRRRRPARRTDDDASGESEAVAEEVVAEEPAATEENQPEPEAEAPPPAGVEISELPAVPEAAGVAPESLPQDLQGLATEVKQLRSLIEQQRGVLAEVRAGLLTLAGQVDRSGYRPRLGVFVDVPNVMYGIEGDREVHMGKLLDLLREGRQLIRATAYSPVSDDPREPLEQQKFVSPFVRYDYRIVTKPLKRFADGSIKGNFDVEMAIDMLSMADRVDVVAIVSGDADFARAVEAVQARGVRVEVIAFAGSTSLEMRALADHYLELSSVVDRIT